MPDDQRRLQEEAARTSLRPDQKQGTLQVKKEVRQIAAKCSGAFHRWSARCGRTSGIAGRFHFGKKPRRPSSRSLILISVCFASNREASSRINRANGSRTQIASQISLNLARRYGTDLSTECAINLVLLGGGEFRVGKRRWDSSVLNRLERLQQQL